MAEIDTSSYPKPTLPVSALDMAGKVTDLQQKLALQPGELTRQQQAIQSTDLGINTQKLELASKALDALGTAMTSLGPNATKEQYKAVGASVARAFHLPSESVQSLNERVNAAPTSQAAYDQIITAIGEHSAAIAYHMGSRQDISNGQSVTPSVTSIKPGFGVRPISEPIQLQQGPDTETLDMREKLPNGKPNSNFRGKTTLGPQPPQVPEGALPIQNGIPGQYRPSVPRGLPTGLINDPAINGPSSNFGGTVTGATVEPTTFNDRFGAARPAGVAKSLPPGTSEAMATSAQGGAVSAVAARSQAANYQREIFPLTQAIPALEKLGPKGTGPGTETINHLKSFAISNIPGVKESDFDGTVADYDKAKKYLTDFVNQTGTTGTNDKLAAAFAGNPSVHISNAAAVDVAKSAYALRRMKQAEMIAFEKSGLPDQDYQKFSVQFNNEQDPRAYGVDLIGKEKLKKLIAGMSPREFDIFKKSIETAHSTKVVGGQ